MPAPKPKQSEKVTHVETFILGVFMTALITIPVSLKVGRNLEREEFERIGTAMEQAQKRHRRAMDRAEDKLEFVHQCVDELQHAAHTSDTLGFCERQANKLF